MAAAVERCEGNDALNIPMVGGAIAVAYNLEGVENLVLSPEAIAGIFASEITSWNDPAIAATNSGVSLPDATIAQFHRSDSSGTTANFSAYLATVAPDIWAYDTGKEWTAPGGQGAKGSDQVTASVEQTPNSIGYPSRECASLGSPRPWPGSQTTPTGDNLLGKPQPGPRPLI